MLIFSWFGLNLNIFNFVIKKVGIGQLYYFYNLYCLFLIKNKLIKFLNDQ